jgi:hypothetical protein
LRVVYAWYRRRALEEGHEDARCGSVTFVQRFGSSLNVNPHSCFAYFSVPEGHVFGEVRETLLIIDFLQREFPMGYLLHGHHASPFLVVESSRASLGAVL